MIHDACHYAKFPSIQAVVLVVLRCLNPITQEYMLNSNSIVPILF